MSSFVIPRAINEGECGEMRDIGEEEGRWDMTFDDRKETRERCFCDGKEMFL